MAKRIRMVWDACGSSCSPEDKFIAAAFAQNGTGFCPLAMGYVKEKDFNWTEYIGRRSIPSDPTAKVRQFITGKQFDTQFMLKLFINDIRVLHSRGYELPTGISLGDISQIEKKYVDPHMSEFKNQ